jgi:hypothetical protein
MLARWGRVVVIDGQRVIRERAALKPAAKPLTHLRRDRDCGAGNTVK